MNKIFDKIIKIVSYPIRLILYFLIYLYKLIISPMLPKSCSFTPTCSTYMLLAIKEWGVIKGVFIGLNRIRRCTPKSKGGIDFVPINLKGEHKWKF